MQKTGTITLRLAGQEVTLASSATSSPRSSRRSGPSTAPPPLTLLPACTVCHDSGWIGVGASQDPVTLQWVPRAEMCECRQRELRRATMEQLSSALGNLSRCRFADAVRPPDERVATALLGALTSARRFADQPLGTLLLIGPPGGGKTFLSACIANALLERGRYPVFAQVGDLLDRLKATFAPAAEADFDQLFSRLKQADVLFLDDFGDHQSSEWVVAKLDQLIDYRYRHNPFLPVVASTNLTELQFRKQYPRIWSRLNDRVHGQVVAAPAYDFRLLSASQRQERFSAAADSAATDSAATDSAAPNSAAAAS